MVEDREESSSRPKRSVRIRRAQGQTTTDATSSTSGGKVSTSSTITTSPSIFPSSAKAANTRANINSSSNKPTPSQHPTRASTRKVGAVTISPSSTTSSNSADNSAKLIQRASSVDSPTSKEQKNQTHASYEDSDDKSKKNVRRSTRDIKRPKFDDEIVDSIAIGAKITPKKAKTVHEIVSGDEGSSSVPHPPSTTGAKKRLSISTPPKIVIKPEIATNESSGPPTRESTPSFPKSENSKVDNNFENSQSSNILQQLQPPKRKRTRPDPNKQIQPKISISNKSVTALIYENPVHQAIVDEILKKWEVEDDITLMAAVHHLCDLQAVLAQAKFSKSLNLSDLDERWYLMLYDEKVSKMISKRISEQSKALIEKVHRKIPFSIEEDKAIQNVDGASNATIETFEKLLQTNKTAFPIWRTSDILLQRWTFLKHGGLVSELKNDQKPNTHLAHQHDDIEHNLDFCNLAQKDVPPDTLESSLVPRDLTEAERQYNELKKAPHEAIAGTTLSPQMPPNVLAQLRGCCVSFNIVSPYVVIGRSTDQFAVDVNLAYEGPCQRVSRAQAVLKLNDNDEFILYNTGRNAIYADKKVIHSKQKAVIVSNTTIEFGIISLLFLRNEAARRIPSKSISSSASPLSNFDDKSETPSSSSKPSVIVNKV